MNYLRWFRYVPVGAAISIYLTSIVDKITLETNLQRFFIFMYFAAIYTLFVFVLQNKRKKEDIDNKGKIVRLISATVLSTIVLFACLDILVDRYETSEVTITALGESSSDAQGVEVWITKIIADGKTIDLSPYAVEGLYEMRDKALAIYPDSSTPKAISLSLPSAKNIKIFFLRHPWSGEVLIQDGLQSTKISLYQPDYMPDEVYIVQSNLPIPISLHSLIIIISALITIGALFYAFLTIDASKKFRFSFAQLCVTFFILVKFRTVFDIFGLNTFLLISVLLCFLYTTAYQWLFKTHTQQWKKILLLCLSFYIAFAFSGHYIFMPNYSLDFSIELLASFLLIWIYVFSMVVLAFYTLWKIDKKSNLSLISRRTDRCFALKCFLASAIPLLLISLIFYPGSIASDGVDQWAQALGVYSINDAHPFMHTVFLRICSLVWNNIYGVVFVQIVMFAGILSSILSFFYKKGFSPILLIACAVLFSLTPNNFMLLFFISKNIPFALAHWWAFALLIKMYDEPSLFFRKFNNYLQLTVCILALRLMRHNGFLAMWSIFILLVFIAISYRKQLQFLPLTIIICSILVTEFVYGPIFQWLEVNSYKASAVVTPLMTPFGSALKNNVELSEHTLQIIESFNSIEEWEQGYSKYSNYMWKTVSPNFSSLSIKDAMQIYLQLLVQRPDIVFKDRLDHMDVLWDVFRPSDQSVMSRYAIGIWPPKTLTEKDLPDLLRPEYKKEAGYYVQDNIFLPVMRTLLSYTGRISILDMLFWRNGIYLVFCLLLLSYAAFYRKFSVLWVATPTIATLLTYVLTYSWAIYEYMWFFPMSVIFLGIYAIACPPSGGDDKIKLQEKLE